ncbi:hypothetical protein [Arsenicicoccus dermatophilus]|uniref:hypothetical protein n=1 Tax=Arsenicicoccus dermatophilus TaxID=1076331 RepID=UPI003916FCF2
MQPSSLVFVVVIGLWAAYLTQSWMRRREHLQTARSLERYAEAITVLQERPIIATSSTRSYAVSPLRPTGSAPRPEADSCATRVATPARPASRRGRTVRALSLVLTLGATVAVVVLAALRLLPLWTPAIGVALLVLDLGWLRHAAKSTVTPRPAPVSDGGRHRGRASAPAARTTRAARRSAAAAAAWAPAAPRTEPSSGRAAVEPAPVPAARPQGRPAERPASYAPPAAATELIPAVQAPAPAVRTVAADRTPITPAPRPRVAELDPCPFDVRSYDEPPLVVVEAEPEPLAPGQWRPVPVPRPTYALKTAAPRAAHPVVAAGSVPGEDDVFAPVEIEDEFLDEPVPLRRVVGG